MSNGSPGTIRLGTTTEDERDCYGVQEDEIVGESFDDKSVGNKYTGKKNITEMIVVIIFMEFPLEKGYVVEEEQAEVDTEIDEVDLREARLVMQVELLSHLLRTVSIEVLQISPKVEKMISTDDSLYGNLITLVVAYSYSSS